MLVADLMERDVTSVEPGSTLADAVRMMISRHVSGLPVVEDGKLVGIVTDGDLLRRAEIDTDSKKHGWFRAFFLSARVADDYVHAHGIYVRDVMTAPAISVAPETPLADVATIMFERHVKRLPVLSAGKLAGMIGRADLLGVLARRFIETDDPLTEADIKAHILNKLAQESWAPKSGIHVKFAAGVVELTGAVGSDAERRAIRVIAETTRGVRRVDDSGLVFVDPTSGMAFPVA